MYSKETLIVNRIGLQAKVASEFTRHATQFSSEIKIKNLDDGQTGDAKSIISVIGLSLPKGTRIEIEADGDDELEAVENLIALVEDRFGEED